MEIAGAARGLEARGGADRGGLVAHRRRASAELREALRVLASRVPSRGTHGAARLPVDRAFSMKGFGTVVTGTLVAGRIEADQELAVLPGGGEREGARRAGARGRPPVRRGRTPHRPQSRRRRGRRRAPGPRARRRRDARGDADSRRGDRAARRRTAAQARRARAGAPGHDGGPRSRRPRAPGGRRGDGARRPRVRADPSGGADRAHARRSLHPSRLLAAENDRGWPRSRSAGAACRAARGRVTGPVRAPAAGRRRGRRGPRSGVGRRSSPSAGRRACPSRPW